jgi:glucosamine-6-phosphate deaminase
MKVIVAKDYEELCRFAGHFVTRWLQMHERVVLGLATGNTMIGFYKVLVEKYRRGEVSFKNVVTFNLDEFVGVEVTHEQSYHYYMKKHFFDHVDIAEDARFLPDGLAKDVLAECERYERLIKEKGGIDLMMLGIGKNGHIAFNEPTSSLASRTRVKRLEDETVEALAQGFGGKEKVPKYVITMGIGTIMESRHILMLASGKGKACAVKDMVEGPIGAYCPATVLQLHPHVFVVIDEDAGSLLNRKYDTVSNVLSDPYEEYFYEGK